MKLPIAFQEKMKALLKEEYEDYIASYQYPKYQGLRINTLKVSQERWKEMNPFENLKQVPWCKEGFYYDKMQQPTKNPYYYAGLYYIQEPSAMAPGAYLPVEPGDCILDMCAAPGGKSTQIGAKLQGKGLLVANDISVSRAKALVKNIEKIGIKNVLVTSESSEKLAQKWPGYFDKILIDAPCSGEGMFRKDTNAMKNWETYGVQRCCNLQQQILEDAAILLKQTGMILYSTCTFSPEENEEMIERFLTKHPEFEVVPLEPVGGIQLAHPEWIDARSSIKGALRLWPHHLEGEGHFVCLLQRKQESNKSVLLAHKKVIGDHKEAAAFIRMHTNLSLELPIREIQNRVYTIPEIAPNLDRMRVLKFGLCLGESKPKRFIPSHALTMALAKEQFLSTITLDSSDERVKRYLKGETLAYEAEKGYHVLCVDDYPLGWVKAQGAMLKNEYPPSWRMMG